MTNRDVRAAWEYHEITKHSVARLRANRHVLDWENKPRPFKVYPNVEAIPLPRELPTTAVPALAAIGQPAASTGDQPMIPDLVSLARVLHFSAGITRRKLYPGGEEMYFRAAACTGALYHIDVYVICGDLPGLSAGVYHFGPHDFALRQLRAGDYRGTVLEATAAVSLQHAPVILACTSTYWRNSWKYQARAYRHAFWDCGTLLANLLAITAADGVPTRLICGFVDERINALLGIDPSHEGAVALVTLGNDPHASPPAPPAMPALALETLPLSPHEVAYPAIAEMHAASSLRTAEEVKSWRTALGGHMPAPELASGAELFPLRPLPDAALPHESIDQLILRRGSSRHFRQAPIGFEQLSTLLARVSTPLDTDAGEIPNEVYLIVNAVEGLPAGAYVCRHNRLELLHRGTFRREAGYLGLGQELPADASVNIYFLCRLEPLISRLGNRGYRVGQLDAAIRGGRGYLAAYALQLGATGLTFFDDEVTDFFSPHAAGKSVMFLLAVGHGRTAPLR